MLSSVMFVTNEYPPEKTAGTAMSTSFLAEELASRGMRVTVVVNTRSNAPPRERSGNLTVIRLKPLGVPSTRMLQRAFLLANVARQIRPDIIQGQSLSCGFLALVAGRLLGIPSAVYVQGYDLYEASPWATKAYIRWALTSSDLAVSVTDDLRRRAYAISGRQTEVVPHGVRIHTAHKLDRHAARVQLGLAQGAQIILFAGQLIPRKGVEYLIRAVSLVAPQYPDARLLLVGDGSDRTPLETLARSLNVGDRVSFVGGRAHEDVIRFMRAADLFVLPSLTEPFGIVLVEAMSCGLPIIASDVMGIPSIVRDATNGFLVPPKDDAALADRMVRLLEDPQSRQRIGLQNQHDAGQYAMPVIAERFLHLWGTLRGSTTIDGRG